MATVSEDKLGIRYGVLDLPGFLSGQQFRPRDTEKPAEVSAQCF